MTIYHTTKLPTFLVIGASKTGTTSLHNYLAQHPEIFMSRIKEPGFFVFDGFKGRVLSLRYERFVTSIEKYKDLFHEAKPYQQRGESSTYYLDFASSDVAKKIKIIIPDVRIIAILRQPVDHAYSRYINLKRDGYIGNYNFESLLRSEMKRYYDLDYKKFNYLFISRSYSKRIRFFLEEFSKEKLLIQIYDDYKNNPIEFVKSIFNFLDVNYHFEPNISVYQNPGALHQSSIIAFLLNRQNPVRFFARKLFPDKIRIKGRDLIRSLSLSPAPKLQKDIRSKLTSYFEKEINDLEKILNRDLSDWRS